MHGCESSKTSSGPSGPRSASAVPVRRGARLHARARFLPLRARHLRWKGSTRLQVGFSALAEHRGGGGESAQEPFASRWQGGLVSERVCRPAERGLFAGKKLVVRWMWRQASVSQAASCMGGNPPRPVRARAGQASLAQFRLAGALRQARARCLPQRARCLRRRVSAWPQVAFSALAENRGGGGECVQEPSESRWEGGLASHKPAISQGQGMHLESADQRSRPRRSP